MNYGICNMTINALYSLSQDHIFISNKKVYIIKPLAPFSHYLGAVTVLISTHINCFNIYRLANIKSTPSISNKLF